METLSERRAAAQVYEQELNRAVNDIVKKKKGMVVDVRVVQDVARDMDAEKTLAE